MIENV